MVAEMFDEGYDAGVADERKRLLPILAAVAACPQAAPWLARLPHGQDSNVWQALIDALAERR